MHGDDHDYDAGIAVGRPRDRHCPHRAALTPTSNLLFAARNCEAIQREPALPMVPPEPFCHLAFDVKAVSAPLASSGAETTGELSDFAFQTVQLDSCERRSCRPAIMLSRPWLCTAGAS